MRKRILPLLLSLCLALPLAACARSVPQTEVVEKAFASLKAGDVDACQTLWSGDILSYLDTDVMSGEESDVTEPASDSSRQAFATMLTNLTYRIISRDGDAVTVEVTNTKLADVMAVYIPVAYAEMLEEAESGEEAGEDAVENSTSDSFASAFKDESLAPYTETVILDVEESDNEYGFTVVTDAEDTDVILGGISTLDDDVDRILEEFLRPIYEEMYAAGEGGDSVDDTAFDIEFVNGVGVNIVGAEELYAVPGTESDIAASDGMKYICVALTVANGGNETLVFDDSIYTMRDTEDVRYYTTTVEGAGIPLLDGESIEGGDTLSGYILFEVPETVTDCTLDVVVGEEDISEGGTTDNQQ